MYLLDQYRGTTLSCRYAIPPHFALTESRTQLKEIVKIAVVDTIMRHPMMQVSIKDASIKTPSWIQLQSLDLTQHIQWLDIEEHDDFERIVQEIFRVHLDDRFPDLSIKQPGWKFTIIRQGNASIMEVLLTWNHPQFDGAGAKIIHEDFLEMLDNVQNGKHERAGLEGDVLKLPQTSFLLPIPIESLKSLPLDSKFFAKVLWEEVRPQFLNRDISQAAWCPIRSPPYKTQFRAFHINNASVLAILSLCRQNKTTITGLLNGLALIAFSSHLDSKAAPAFQSSTMIDHRRNLPHASPDAPWVRSDKAVSNYVTQLPHRYNKKLVARIRSKLPANASNGVDLSVDMLHELWFVSAHNRLEILRKLEIGLRNDIVGMFKYVTDWQKTMRKMAKRKRQFSWIVTNIGVIRGSTSTKDSSITISSSIRDDIKSSDSQRWSIIRAQFGLSAEIPAAAIEIAPVSVAGQGMCVGFIWPDCALDVGFGERIVTDLDRWLNQLASQS